MARSDLLINLVKAGTLGDQPLFRKTVEAVIAEERGKNHTVLADRLADAASSARNNGHAKHQPTLFPVSAGSRTISSSRRRPSAPWKISSLPEATRDCMPRTDRGAASPIPPSLLQPRAAESRAARRRAGQRQDVARRVPGPRTDGPFVVARYDGLIASYLGETASRLNKLFEYVRTRACVLFFDEFDTIGKERGDVHETGEIKRVVSSLLLQIDALPSHVVVVTATNHPELLDRAVWRRFQLRLELPRPTARMSRRISQTSNLG